jgi:hypothetical protein
VRSRRRRGVERDVRRLERLIERRRDGGVIVDGRIDGL